VLFGVTYRPVVDFAVKTRFGWIPVLAYADSGADITLLPNSFLYFFPEFKPKFILNTGRKFTDEMKLCILLGTRPEIIKMSPVIRECEHRNLDYFILHTGQHYSYNLDRIFFEQLELPEAQYNLDVGSGTHGEQTGKILAGVEQVLQKEQPDVVLVEGDTNTVLAGALAAAKLDIKVGHVEAGLRSYDRQMPEEINRVLTDHCSDYLFAPTENAKRILLGEGISDETIFVTGNTIVDAIHQNMALANTRNNALKDLNLDSRKYFLVTAHRQENVDVKTRFEGIINGLEVIGGDFGMPVIYPIHPRARKMLNHFGVQADGIVLIEPVDYLSFLQLEANARLVLTDSGGVQEETCILHVPCVTLRDNTERPETLEVVSNILVGTEPERIFEGVKVMLERENKWRNPFGDGKAGERIVRIVVEVQG
jgi:UDP-N-acetylglucosamine 2-epimerase (non-hydrolysing)